MSIINPSADLITVKRVDYKEKRYEVIYQIELKNRTPYDINMLTISKVNNVPITKEAYRIDVFQRNWFDNESKRESIIGHIKTLIDRYIEVTKPVKATTIFDNFKNWNGDLDHWDE